MACWCACEQKMMRPDMCGGCHTSDEDEQEEIFVSNAMTDTEILDWLEREKAMADYHYDLREWAVDADSMAAMAPTLREAVEKAASLQK